MKITVDHRIIVALAVALAGCGRGDVPASGHTGQPGGAQAFVQCSTCHSVEANGPRRVGPSLHNVIGRKAGSLAGFSYSPALRDSGVTWSPQTLDQFLQNPKAMVPGTRMAVSVRDPEQRRAIIAYLGQY
jgi:cytochrome c